MPTTDEVDNIDIGTQTKEKKSPLKWILALVLIIGIIAAILRFDIGGVGSKFIYPTLSKVPIINKLVPGETETKIDKEVSQKDNQISNLELIIEQLEEDNIQLSNQIEILEVFEQEQVSFKEEKMLFDQNVASMNKEDFIQYYEEMHPENASNIYLDLNQDKEIMQKQKKYSNMIAEMDETQAAKVLENLFDTDMDIILLILDNMDMERTAAILGEMESSKAAVVVKQLAPQ